jgi:hypothetical protein
MMTKHSGIVLILVVCVASFVSGFSALSLSPTHVVNYTVTQPYFSTITQTHVVSYAVTQSYLSTITQSVTVSTTATAYVTKTEIQGYPQYVTQYITVTATSQSGASYGSMVTLTFLHFSSNNSLLLEATAVSPTGIGMSIGFHCEPYRVSDYIPYTYQANLSVPSGQNYWIIVRNLSLGSNVAIQVQDTQNPFLSTVTVNTPFLMYISGPCQFRVP